MNARWLRKKMRMRKGKNELEKKVLVKELPSVNSRRKIPKMVLAMRRLHMLKATATWMKL